MQSIAVKNITELPTTDDVTAENCLIALKDGDRDALSELYRLASASVYSYALSVLRSKHDAEDVLHDCFVNIFTSAGAYTPRGKPFAWIITIAKNLCLMKLRERKRFASGAEADDDRDMAFAEESGIAPEDRLMIRRCLKLLSEEEHRIVVLHAVAGFKHREIAEITGIPLMTVISKYRRAIQKLRQSLE